MKHPQNSWLFLWYNIASESIWIVVLLHTQGAQQDPQHDGHFHIYHIKSLKIGLEKLERQFWKALINFGSFEAAKIQNLSFELHKF